MNKKTNLGFITLIGSYCSYSTKNLNLGVYTLYFLGEIILLVLEVYHMNTIGPLGYK